MKKCTQHIRHVIGATAVLALGMCLAPNANAQVLINEDFSTATVYAAPSGWTNVSNNTAAAWNFNDACDRIAGGDIDVGTTAMGGTIAFLDSDCTEDDHNADLTTPAFDASLPGNYVLEFDNSILNYSSQLCEVQVWNGSAWTTVFSVFGADDGPYVANHKSINITSAVGTSSAAQVRFHYEGDYEYWWALDNVKITRLNCSPPVATFSTVPDCANGQYSVSVNLTSMGSATSVAIKEGTTTYATATAPGTYAAGPFASGTAHNITLEHNLDNGCTVVSPAQQYVCPATNDECGTAITLTPSLSCNPLTATTTGATASTESSSCVYIHDGDVWFSFVATAPEYTINVSNVMATNATLYAFGLAAYSGACGTLTEIDCSVGSQYFGETPAEITLTGLTSGQTIYLQVWEDEAYDGSFNPISTDLTFDICAIEAPPPPVNDDASAAIALTVGAPCTGAAYTTASATHNAAASEPYANCESESTGDHSVWFSFVAPTSGAVKITTDNGTAGTLDDTKIGLFAATNPADYTTFSLLACDEDNGVDNNTTDLLSTIFATGLTGGTTYYIEVDGYDPAASGTFCVQVEEINPTMLSNSATCANISDPYGTESSYTGWVTLVDEDGKLVALVKNNAGGEAGSYGGTYNIDGDGFQTPRQDGNGTYYLSRNYNINNPDVTSPVTVQFFFHPGEIATLSGVTGNTVTLSNLNVTHQAGSSCFADFSESNGATSVLLQNGNGVVNGVSWIQVETPGFSNFYLMGGTTPLYIELKDFGAINEGSYNRIEWTTVKEEAGEYFELERSADSKTFSFLARIEAKGNPGAYVFRDEAPLQGTGYYRLKLNHKEGKPTYSKVASATLSIKNSFNLQALPNPVTHTLQVNISGSRDGAMVTLTDLAGKILHRYAAGNGVLQIDMSTLANGLYFVKYQDSDHTETIKVTKQ